ncbi:MAG: cobalt ECF transporter T component CbiQ [Planctomycetota bacterium]
MIPSATQHWTAAVGSHAYLARVDPRLRIVAVVVLSVLIAAATHFGAALAGLAIGLMTVPLAGVPLQTLARRLVPLNLVVLLMALLLPLTTPGRPLAHVGPWPASWEGLVLAGMIAVKGNAIVLLVVTLVGTIEPIAFGHALSHLYVPTKLVHLLLFAVRYFEVLHQEYVRLRAAMKVRGFRPQMNLHTYRALGNLVGMLLVRSHDRAERILAAMKCRGFHGRFYLLDHFAFRRSDIPFALAALAAAGGLVWLLVAGL